MIIDLKPLEALIEGNKYKVTILSNASAYLYHSLENINWLGFYLLCDKTLYLGPFQGKIACIEIPVGKGVCGNTIKEDKTLVVDNVLEYPGHIACDSNSRSEVCIPLHIGDMTYGLLDIDSPIFNRFNKELVCELEKAAKIIEDALEKAI
ncbi:MAG: GAF domain-containing protein [Acholeplasmatales bacterium]|nr:GAF domain-containing protein [Acholeplasmatales bacterium]